MISYDKTDSSDKEISITIDDINGLLGLEISKKEII